MMAFIVVRGETSARRGGGRVSLRLSETGSWREKKRM
jgi:hypothetical protein